MYILIRWVDGHVRGLYAAVGVYLLIGLACMGVAVALFGMLAALVSGGLTQGVDQAIMRGVAELEHPMVRTVALEVTALGGVGVMWMTLLLASAFFWVTSHHYSVLLLWSALVGGSTLNFLLKSLFERPRPELFAWRTELVANSSFPSGHSMTAVALYATLAYLIVRLEPTVALRRMTLALAAGVILLIGSSRVYLGVHYPTDVLAGFLVGLGWASFCALGIEAVRYFRHGRSGEEVGERDVERGTEPIREALGGGD